jgi:quinol monooxygenase YgiN
MIISLLRLSPIPEKRQTILDILRFVEDKVLLKRGCLGCGIYAECDKGRSILYLEQWRSKEENHVHIQSKLYMRLLNAMDLGREAPEIFFIEVSDSKGMDLIEALRARCGSSDSVATD